MSCEAVMLSKVTQPTPQGALFLLDLPRVASALSVSESTVQLLVRQGSFPKSRQISGRRVGWQQKLSIGLRHCQYRTNCHPKILELLSLEDSQIEVVIQFA